MYRVTATATRTTYEGGVINTVTRQLPTFFLDPDVQGIIDERHARKIALDVVQCFSLGFDVYFHFSIVRESPRDPVPPSPY